jgi:predicted nucleic acid-binding protein
MIVVSGTTPLRHLIAIGEAELLPKLYGTVIVPGAVWAELQAESTPLIVKTWPVRSPPPIGRLPAP